MTSAKEKQVAKQDPKQEAKKSETLEDLIVKDATSAVRFFMASYGKPASYKSRMFASAVDVPEFSPLLYIPFEALSPSLDQYLTNPNFKVILPLESAGRSTIYDWVMKKLLPLLAKQEGHKAIFFDGICSFLMDSTFRQAKDECIKAALRQNNQNHDPEYPCRQCYGRLTLKAQAFITDVRELWKNNPDNAAHILMTFREKLDEKTVGKGENAVTTRTYRPELPNAALRVVTHEIQTYIRLGSTFGIMRDDKGNPLRDSDKKPMRGFKLRIQSSNSDELEARDNTGSLKGEIILEEKDINFKSLLKAMNFKGLDTSAGDEVEEVDETEETEIEDIAEVEEESKEAVEA